MKRLSALLPIALLLSACGSLHFGPAEPQAPAAPARPAAPALASDGTPRVALDGVEIERVAFRPGVSSVTVEKLARRAQCTGGVGAGLVTPSGPVEVYRMACDNGRVFMARCELRQCKPM